MEARLKSFPSYDIAKLRWLLAQSYERESKLMKVIDEICGLHWGSCLCGSCITLQPIENVFQCRECNQWGCGKCNIKTKGVIECAACFEGICEKCDPLVLQDGLTPLPGEWTCTRCSN